MNINDFIDEFLSFEKTPDSFAAKVGRFVSRKDIAKQVNDEIEHDTALAIKRGNDAEEFIGSKYYLDIIEPFIRGSLKSGLQKIIRESDAMTESQIRSEIAGIRKVLGLLGNIKMRVSIANSLKGKGNEV